MYLHTSLLAQEKERWRESTFDKRVEEVLKPYRDRLSNLDNTVTELKHESDGLRQSEESLKEKNVLLKGKY